MAFIPLYDHTGTTQLTCSAQEWRDFLTSLRTETVIKAIGVVQERPDIDQNKVFVELKKKYVTLIQDRLVC